MYILVITREGYETIEQRSGLGQVVKAFSSKEELMNEMERFVLEKHCSVAGWKDPVFRKGLTTTGAFSSKQGWLRIFKKDGSYTYMAHAHKIVMPGWTEEVKLTDRLTVVCWESGLTNYDILKENNNVSSNYTKNGLLSR